MATNVSLTVPFKTKKMKINQADTAIKCFHELPQEHFTREETMVLGAIHLGFQTISGITRHTGIEKSSVSRALNTLHHKKEKISIEKKATCPISKKLVSWYQIKIKT